MGSPPKQLKTSDVIREAVIATVVAVVTALIMAGLCRADESQVMPSSAIDSIRSAIPVTDDDRLNAILTSKHAIWYTEREMPAAFQWDLPRTHTIAQSPYRNVSADNEAPHFEASKRLGGNANIEFPWRHPGGTDATEGVETFKFFALPVDASGRRLPVVYWTEHFTVAPGFADPSPLGYRWRFPVGTVFGEVLTMAGPNGRYVFEIRTRTREQNRWSVDVLRPFRDADDYAAGLASIGIDSSSQLVSMTQDMIASKHPQNRFVATGRVHNLAPISSDAVDVLLRKTPLRSAVGSAWNPETDAEFHIVPRGYRPVAVGSDSASCMKCHENTLQHARDFDIQRGWYGYVRGGDGILSWHPFDPSCVNHSGSVPIRMRRTWEHAGVVRRWSDDFDARWYQSLSGGVK